MRCLPPSVVVLALLASPVSAAPPAPVELFNGRDFDGWEYVTTPAVAITTVCHLQPDGRIGFQLEGNPFELRRVRVVRLD